MKRITLDGWPLMFGDVLISKRVVGPPGSFIIDPGGQECTVAALQQPTESNPGRVVLRHGPGRMSSLHPDALSQRFRLADAPRRPENCPVPGGPTDVISDHFRELVYGPGATPRRKP